jgi:hypothetical protein
VDLCRPSSHVCVSAIKNEECTTIESKSFPTGHSGDKRMLYCVAFPIPANPARFAISVQVFCYVLSFIVRSNARHHTNAWRPFGSTCRGRFKFWSRFFVGAHRQGPSARSSHTLSATSFQSYLVRQRSSPLSPKRSRIRP